MFFTGPQQTNYHLPVRDQPWVPFRRNHVFSAEEDDSPPPQVHEPFFQWVEYFQEEEKTS